MVEPLASAIETRSNRRRAARALLAGAGGALLALAVARTAPRVIAQSGDDEDDDSGHGRGRGRGGDNSGPGNAEDRGDGAVPVPEIPAGSLEVRIVSDDAGGFVPAELTVNLGQLVTFVNSHSDEHTATGSGFDTGIIPEGGIATVVLDTPGSFRYACQIHPVMTGRIDVRDENGVVPQATPEQAPAGADTVRIANLTFTPGELTVPIGATVVWRNEDAVPHTVTADDGSFDSGIFDLGATFSQTFEQPGAFPYHCQLHPNMQGTIRVGNGAEAAAAQPAATPASEPTIPATPAAAGATVSIVDFAFEPPELGIAVGTTVTWTNTGAAPHTVTGDWASSDVLAPGQTFAHTFDGEGRFAYACAIHPEMMGTVVVAPATTGAGLAVQDTPEAAGVWRIALAADDPATMGTYEALFTLHPDGALAADFAVAATPLPASALTSGHGTWQLQDSGLALSFVALLQEETRSFAGTVTIEAQAGLAADAQTLDGTFAYAISGANEASASQGVGSLSGERVLVAP